MSDEEGSKLFEYVDRMGEIQKRMTHIFLCSLALSALVTFDLAYVSVGGGALWSITITTSSGLFTVLSLISFHASVTR